MLNILDAKQSFPIKWEIDEDGKYVASVYNNLINIGEVIELHPKLFSWTFNFYGVQLGVSSDSKTLGSAKANIRKEYKKFILTLISGNL